MSARVTNVIFLNYLPAAARELHSLLTLPCGLAAFPLIFYIPTGLVIPARLSLNLIFPILSPKFLRDRLFTLSILNWGIPLPSFTDSF